MLFSWWFLWLIFMILCFASPVSYGWGYRGWGPPYPSYVQRRRMERAALANDSTFNHQAWGRSGDAVWLLFAVGMFWASTALWWRW